jgi:hypothetical protein
MRVEMNEGTTPAPQSAQPSLSGELVGTLLLFTFLVVVVGTVVVLARLAGRI